MVLVSFGSPSYGTLHWDFVVDNFVSYYRQQTKLREGNVFTPVCDSVHGGEACMVTGMHGGEGACMAGSICGGKGMHAGQAASEADGTHLTGMHSCDKIVI